MITNLRGKERRNMSPNQEVPTPGDTRYNGSFLLIKYNYSYFANFHQVIKLMNSKDSYVNLRLMNFVSLLINLRDSLLSLQSDDT